MTKQYFKRYAFGLILGAALAIVGGTAQAQEWRNLQRQHDDSRHERQFQRPAQPQIQQQVQPSTRFARPGSGQDNNRRFEESRNWNRGQQWEQSRQFERARQNERAREIENARLRAEWERRQRLENLRYRSYPYNNSYNNYPYNYYPYNNYPYNGTYYGNNEIGRAHV